MLFRSLEVVGWLWNVVQSENVEKFTSTPEFTSPVTIVADVEVARRPHYRATPRDHCACLVTVTIHHSHVKHPSVPSQRLSLVSYVHPWIIEFTSQDMYAASYIYMV